MSQKSEIDIDVSLAQAESLFAEKRYEEARRAYQDLLENCEFSEKSSKKILYKLSQCAQHEEFQSELDLLLALKEFYESLMPGYERLLCFIHAEIGSFYRETSFFDKALRHFLAAYDLANAILLKTDPHLLSLCQKLAYCYFRTHKIQDALFYYEQYMSIAQVTGNEKADYSSIYTQIGFCYNESRKWPEAIAYFKKSMEILNKKFGRHSPAVLNLYSNIALAYFKSGNLLKSLNSYEKCLKHHENSSTPLELAEFYSEYGLCLLDLGQFYKAFKYFLKCKKLVKLNSLSNHKDLGISYSNLGLYYEAVFIPSLSLKYYSKALRIFQESLHENDQELGKLYLNMSRSYLFLSQIQEALESLEKCKSIYELALPSNDQSFISLYMNIGQCYYKLSNFNEALVFLEKSRQVCEESLPEDHKELGIIISCIGRCHQALNNPYKALELFEKAKKILEHTLPAQHFEIGKLYNEIGIGYMTLGMHQEAFGYMSKSKEILEEVLPNSLELAFVYQSLGMMCSVINKNEFSLELLENARKIYERILPKGHPDLHQFYVSLGLISVSIGKMKEALVWFEKCEKDYVNGTKLYPDASIVYQFLGAGYLKSENFSMALEKLTKAKKLMKKSLDKRNENFKELYRELGVCHHKLGNTPKASDCYHKALQIYERFIKNESELYLFYKEITYFYMTTNQESKSKELLLKLKKLKIKENRPSVNVDNLFLTKDQHQVKIETFLKTLKAYEGFSVDTEEMGALCQSISAHYMNLGDHSNGLLYIQRAVNLVESSEPLDELRLAFAYCDLAQALSKTNKSKQAVEYYKKCLKIREQKLQPKDPELARTYINYAACLIRMEKYNEALKLLEKCRVIREEILHENHIDLGNLYSNFAACYFHSNKFEKAAIYFQKSLDIYNVALPKGDPKIPDAMMGVKLSKEMQKVRH